MNVSSLSCSQNDDQYMHTANTIHNGKLRLRFSFPGMNFHFPQVTGNGNYEALCIIITKKSDMSITLIYHAMSLTVPQYCISITKKSDMSITVIYHAMSLTTVSVSVSLRTS
jgi:hypothetical protein